MICGDMRSARVMADMRVEEAQRVARSRGPELGPGDGPWACARLRFCRMLNSLGHGLMTLSRRLERSALQGDSA
jgi:hypothetical protein